MKLTTYSLRSLWVRRTTTLATAGGIALVVFVLSASRMLAWGMRQTMSSSGNTDQALVMQHDAWAEAGSRVDQTVLSRVAAAPGVKRNASGQAMVTGEAVGHVLVPSISDKHRISTIQVRGISENVSELRPEVKITSGRMLTAGTDEAVVGKGVFGRYQGLTLGGSFELSSKLELTVVGVFASGGSAYESEVWADLESVRSALALSGKLSSITAQLESESGFDGFSMPLTMDKQTGLSVARESGYYQKVSSGMPDVIAALGVVETLIFSLGAVLGAMITMYASVSQRRKEIGVLRALGFGRAQILSAFMIESVALALAGALFGVLLALLTPFLDFATINFATGQEVNFRFVPSLDILLMSVAVGTGVGAFGGFLPALGAARINPVQAMRM